MKVIENHSCDTLIVLNSLVAEGCPQLALQLSKYWREENNLNIELLCLNKDNNDLEKEFNQLEIPIIYFNIGNGLSRYLRLIFYSYKLCQRRQPKSLLSFPFGWHLFISLGARLAGVKTICAHVGNLPPKYSGISFEKFKLLVQLARPLTKKLICCSNYIREATIKDFNLSEKETITIYNACDVNRFSKDLSIEKFPKNDIPLLAMVARFEQHKDQPTLIKAIKKIQEASIPIKVWLIGDGSKRQHLENLIQELNLSETIKILGMRRDIPELLKNIEIFVFAAKPDEGFGIALAEAMAAEVPIIATNVGACREVLDQGALGLLVEPSSPNALARGIIEVLNHPDAAIKRAYKAKQKAMKVFTINKMANAYRRELNF